MELKCVLLLKLLLLVNGQSGTRGIKKMPPVFCSNTDETHVCVSTHSLLSSKTSSCKN